jgi:hypothetical protein
MLNVMPSMAASKNPGLVNSTRTRDEDNVEWLEWQLKIPEMRREVSESGPPTQPGRQTGRPPMSYYSEAATGPHFDSDSLKLTYGMTSGRVIGLTSSCWTRRRPNSVKQISMRYHCSRV